MARNRGGSQFATYINPLLASLRELGGSARAREAMAAVARVLGLPEAVLDEKLESGSPRFDNQVAWARYYLARAGYIDASKRGVWTLTEKGRNTRALSEDEIRGLIRTVIAKWGRKGRPGDLGTASPEAENMGTRGLVDEGRDHQGRLMSLLMELPAPGFERLCQRLLREAGFEQVTVTGKSGDGGIDGIGVLEINPFVTFKVLFQCKRYQGTVSSSTVRDFRGAMQGRADKGIILTTGGFSAEARREAARDGAPPIELVDGAKLLELFEKLELGLTPRTAFDVEESFFDEFRD